MTCDERAPNRLWLAIIGLALLAGFAFQGSRGLYESTEGRYAECAREMIERGNYIEPTLNYRHHWSKPPLTYWAIAAGMKAFGENEMGARFVNGVAFTLTVLAVAGLAAALWGETAGLVAGLVYASSPLPVLAAFALSTDTLLTFFEVLAVLCYVKATRPAAQHRRAWVIAMWAAFGLGFLTKGPPALIPLLPLVVWHLRCRPEHVRILNAPGIAAFLAIGFSWYVVCCIRHPELVVYFLGRETFDRVFEESNRNPQWYQPFKLYLPLLTVGAGPWLYFVLKNTLRDQLYAPARLWAAIRGTASAGRTGTGVNCSRVNCSRALLLLWLLLPLAIFFVVKSRLPLYVLPLYAPIALAAARAASRGIPATQALRRAFPLAAATLIALIAIKGLFCHYSTSKDMKALYQTCRLAAAQPSEVIACDPKLFGLQFYLGGKLKRVCVAGQQPWADESVEHLLGRMKAASPAASYLVIADRSSAALLADLLRGTGLACRCTDTGPWVLVSVHNPRPRPDRGAGSLLSSS